MDKRENNDLLIDFVFIKYLPNRKIVDDQQPAVNSELWNCYFYSTFEYLIQIKLKMGRKKK